jgi:hypothetical protein
MAGTGGNGCGALVFAAATCDMAPSSVWLSKTVASSATATVPSPTAHGQFLCGAGAAPPSDCPSSTARIDMGLR